MRKFSLYINESKNHKGIDDLPTKESSILFTDIEGSSKHWVESESSMFECLEELEDMMSEVIEKNNGMIVKTIGDSFMCSYESETALLDSIKSAIDIQESLNKEPIKSERGELKVRIGICFGEVFVKETKIQGVELKDYFGNSVGSASRLESYVSEVDGFVFSFLSDIDNEEEILSYLKDSNIDIEVIEYDETCIKSSERKRSSRLLTDLQINTCKNIKELKGVKPLIAYKCTIK